MREALSWKYVKRNFRGQCFIDSVQRERVDSYYIGLGFDVSCGTLISSQTQRKNCKSQKITTSSRKETWPQTDRLVSSKSIDPFIKIQCGCWHAVRHDQKKLLQCHNDQPLDWTAYHFWFMSDKCWYNKWGSTSHSELQHITNYM